MLELRVEFEPPLARIRLDRPERRNAMSKAMWLELVAARAQIEARDDIRAVIVEGVGGHFCAGADISEFEDVFAGIEATRSYLDAIEAGLTALVELERPTIAILEGNSIGGGLAIGLCCDLRFCADDAHLAIPPAKLGILYGAVETRRLVEAVGPARARDLLFSARRVPTEEALAIGLVDRRVSSGEVRAAAEVYAREIAALSGISIRGAKKAVEAVLARDAAGLRALVESAATGADFREGRAAFAEKRKPRF